MMKTNKRSIEMANELDAINLFFEMEFFVGDNFVHMLMFCIAKINSKRMNRMNIEMVKYFVGANANKHFIIFVD